MAAVARGDLAYVAALRGPIHAAPWSIGNFRDSLAAGYSACIGQCESRILVYGVLTLAPGEAQLLNLSVVPDARRRGLGRALLRRFIDDARRLGAEQLFLEVRSSNIAAIGLYETEGFARRAPATRTTPRHARCAARGCAGDAAPLEPDPFRRYPDIAMAARDDS